MSTYTKRAYKAQMLLAWPPNKAGMKGFVKAWINDAICRYSQSAGTFSLTLEDAKLLFQKCLASGLGPAKILRSIGPPPETCPHILFRLVEYLS
jgi:hypothetical protein